MRKFLIASAAAVMAAGIAATPADAQYYGGYSPYGYSYSPYTYGYSGYTPYGYSYSPYRYGTGAVIGSIINSVAGGYSPYSYGYSYPYSNYNYGYSYPSYGRSYSYSGCRPRRHHHGNYVWYTC